MKTEAHLLLPWQVEHYWPAISKELDTIKHMWEIWWTKEALYDAAMNRYMDVWVIGSETEVYLTVFTQIVHYPANKILRIVLILGNHLDDCYDMTEAAIQKFAKDNECMYVEAIGRDGWRRKIKGATYHGVMLTRSISNIKVQ